jgi:hypothetical protein
VRATFAASALALVGVTAMAVLPPSMVRRRRRRVRDGSPAADGGPT